MQCNFGTLKPSHLLTHLPVRLAQCIGKAGKPTVFINKTLGVFLGNPTDQEMVVSSGELFGFNTGAFEVKLISGCLALLKIPRINFSMMYMRSGSSRH